MKKYLSGTAAILFAVMLAAFTNPEKNLSDPSFDWQTYDASGNPTPTFITNQTLAQMQFNYPLCNSNNTICFRQWNLGHTVPNGVYLKKAS